MHPFSTSQNSHIIPPGALRAIVISRCVKAPAATANLIAELVFGAGREDQPMLPSSAAEHLRTGLGGAR